jgi:hypothetical protein
MNDANIFPLLPIKGLTILCAHYIVSILTASLNSDPEENYARLKHNEDLIVLFSAAVYLTLSSRAQFPLE